MKQIVDMAKLEPTIREIVQAGGKVKLTVTGQSMLPTLTEKRDSVILEKPVKIKRKDIVLYQRKNGDYVLHRVVKISKGMFGLCGDNQMAVEYPIGEDQILAVASAIVRKGKLIDKNNLLYKFCAFVWINTIPIRPVIYKMVIKIKLKLNRS